ncbi:MAG: DUF4261 domain-containing protein [Methylobacteriaceae bacterium]|jgi:hypothetical protein|nr:DUF4261 domain-containing protein [Methylobacteriaceae bacterium]
MSGQFMTMTGLVSPNPEFDVSDIEQMGREIVGTDEFTIDIIDEGGEDGAPVVIQCNGFELALLLVEKPIPADALTDAYEESAVFWPDVPGEFRRHRGHLVVSLSQELTKADEFLEAAFTVTVVTAAISEVTESVGTYWADADWVTPRKETLNAAYQACQGEPPVSQWIRKSLRPGRNKTVGVFTCGLLPFVGREIEFPPDPNFDADTIIDRVDSLAKYVISNGLVVQDNDTVGISQEERIRVIYADSKVTGTPVLRLRLEQQQ